MYSEQEEQIEETSSFRKVHASNQSGAQQLSIDWWLLSCNWLLIKKKNQETAPGCIFVFIQPEQMASMLSCLPFCAYETSVFFQWTTHGALASLAHAMKHGSICVLTIICSKWWMEVEGEISRVSCWYKSQEQGCSGGWWWFDPVSPFITYSSPFPLLLSHSSCILCQHVSLFHTSSSWETHSYIRPFPTACYLLNSLLLCSRSHTSTGNLLYPVLRTFVFLLPSADFQR